MGKDLKGKELGIGISQQADKLYVARFTDRFGRRKTKRFKKLRECRQWIADASFLDEHSDVGMDADILVDAWYEYWIDIKRKTVRPNTVRNYSERYERNIKGIIGKKLISEVKPIHCQKILSDMAEQGYSTSTIYQARITIYNMFEFAKENDVILKNPCKKSVKSDIGKPSKKKEALTIEEQRKFLIGATGQSYENQFKFILQTGLRTGELVGLKWTDIDLAKRMLTVSRTMEYRYEVGEWRTGPPKSNSGYRAIPLTNEAVKILKDQKEKNSSIKIFNMAWKDQVFLCKKGEPVKNSTYDTALFKICDSVGIRRFSMHVLRHTFATRCIEAGMIPKTLQKILGHSNIGITMDLYVHVTEDEKVKEMELVEKALMIV